MADASNVVNPQANSANLPQLVQSLLAGSSQPVAPTPVVPTPSPVVQQNTSKWENILHGALLGLTGGLKAGLQNIQDAGTPRGPHANGLAMGEQEILADQQRQQAQQTQQYEQQREQFSDQLAARRAQQQDIFNRARTAEANLHSLQLGLAIDNAPKEAQDAYYKDQNARLKDMETAQVPDLGVVTSLSALPTFLKAHNLSIGGIVPIHTRAADGSDEIHIFQNPDAPADVNAVNRTLKSVGGQPIPAGSSISWRDAHSLIGQAQTRYATFLNQQSLQSQKDKAAMERTKYEVAHRPASPNAAQAVPGTPEWNARIMSDVEQLHNGQLAWSQASKGMGTLQSTYDRDLRMVFHKLHPEDNLAVLQAYSKMAENPTVQNQIMQARTLFGHDGQPGTFDNIDELVKQIPSGVHAESLAGQKLAWSVMGNTPMSKIKRLLPEVSIDLAQFQTGAGGRQSDTRIEHALQQMETADTRKNLIEGFKLLRQAASERLQGIIGPNPYLKYMAKDINDPVKGQSKSQTPQGRPVRVNGVIIGYTTDGKTMTPVK